MEDHLFELANNETLISIRSKLSVETGIPQEYLKLRYREPSSILLEYPLMEDKYETLECKYESIPFEVICNEENNICL